MASASDDNTVRVWNARDGSLATALGLDAVLQAVAWSNDGTRLAISLDNHWAILTFD